ncbi:glutathione S-transferase family protein [Altererythrobacter sp. CC-YST694]|uniref:glutathione S-transferase family protein n=1 Tax=Altererythrobacter sp. CC-YST694 TaxID=2755038 RepID=UPI001D00E42C|nr:glutathione S-transferase family protein [Altererythrobacter sp. CC-YST694]MCB5424908.1 glutathione S-transferase family protein [Altererythrobacter sp. CC-YST694]
MADFTFFTNPMSRGQIARWALHEAGASYDEVIVEWDAKPAELLAANPLGKVPTVIHHTPGGDRVISEAAAICAYLAADDLAPREEERADYFRWLFFTAGPIEQGVTARRYGYEPKEARDRISVGWGDTDAALAMLEGHLAEADFVCGKRFTMADVYVGSQVEWGMMFGTFPERPAFTAYVERFRARDAYKAAKAIDYAQIAERQAQG